MKMQTHTVEQTHILTHQTQSLHTLCSGRPGPDPIRKHLHTHTHTEKPKHIYLDWVLDWKADSPFTSLRCFFPVNTQNKSAFASAPAPITIMRHICHINFVHHEMYRFSNKSGFIYGAAGMQQLWRIVCYGKNVLKVESSAFIFMSVFRIHGSVGA